MHPLSRFYQWLGFRPKEARILWLSFAGAFLTVGYMVLARSLREALYLDAFDVKTLPYITGSVVALGFPTAAIFSHFLSRHSTQNVLKAVVIIALAGLTLLWPIAHLARLTIVLFYLWTSLATIVLTAGFWIVVSEHFPLRGAKRLYGWISAGGTAGAMIVGTSLQPLAKKVPVFQLMPAVMALLGLLLLVFFLMPKLKERKAAKVGSKKVSLREEVQLVWNSPYLFAIAIIVITATLASQLVDFQFKEFVKSGLKEKAAMAGFFGAFYGWTGGISLFLQIVVTSKMLSKAGIGWTLAVLPLVLLGGSVALLVIPTFVLATAIRGSDNTLRKSLHRSAIEVLYLPVPSVLRRKTKTFIDSVLDSAAEGFAALLIFFVVTLGNIPSRYLSIIVFASAALFMYQAKRMNRQYYDSLVERLREGEKEAKNFEAEEEEERGYGQDLLSASFSAIDLQESLKKRGIVFEKTRREASVEQAASRVPAPQSQEDVMALLTSNEPEKIQKALESEGPWEPAHIPGLVRLMVRDTLFPRVSKILQSLGEKGLNPLVEALMDEENDFVIRRRIPKILAKLEAVEAEDALLKALRIERFEIRYRAAIALMQRRKAQLPHLPKEEEEQRLWEAIRFEVGHERPVWEMQKLLDDLDEEEQDDFPAGQVEARGQLSLEHVFRLLALVHDPKLIRTAYQGLFMKDNKLRSFALEYLDHVLPDDVQEKLWPFIGDVSEYEKRKAIRPLEEVAKELVETGATLLIDKKDKKKLLEALEKVEAKR